MAAEAGLAAGDGRTGAQAQGGDVRAATVAHLGDQRQVLEAGVDFWGGQEKSSAGSLRL